MKLFIDELILYCKKTTEKISLRHVNFFYGQMGAGKSTIARLIDYCLGGKLEMTPALQSEFVKASIVARVGTILVVLSRERESDQIEAVWQTDSDGYRVILPARKAGSGEVLPGIEVLSDLLFSFMNMQPPRVRKSKSRDDSELVRLSFRDLFKFCYLDQDEIDSNFFELGKDGDQFRRLKSRDAFRFVIGFHQERVAELEEQLEQIHLRKRSLEEGISVLSKALMESDIGNIHEVHQTIEKIRAEIKITETKILENREELSRLRTHAVEELQRRGRSLSTTIQSIENAMSSIGQTLDSDQRHRNELIGLSLKLKRGSDARTILGSVEYTSCPRCNSLLPDRTVEACKLCGQPHVEENIGQNDLVDADVKSRIDELEDVIAQDKRQLEKLRRQLKRISDEKQALDEELERSSKDYDSTYLSRALVFEREQARLEQALIETEKIQDLLDRIEGWKKESDSLDTKASELRRELKDAREAAERDTKNLKELEHLFIDCLVRSKIPGFGIHDNIGIESPWFLPEVTAPGEEGLITSFSRLGSGGKKTLFKCCYAVALHRLAVSIGAALPSVLVIDTPMKNISERENKAQFEGFYTMLYELALSELSGTQIIIIDKEFFPPLGDAAVDIVVRHMRPDDENFPPLIPYYRGH